MKLLTRDKSFYKEFFSLMIFVALQNLVTYGVSLADNIMLGKFSQTALSGVALANQIQFLLQMIVGSAGEGVVVLAAQYWGAKNRGPISDVTSIGLRVSLVTGFAFMLVAMLLPRQILLLLNNEENVIEAGIEYLRVIQYTYPIFCISTIMLATLRSVGNAQIGFAVSIASLLVNVLLNYCLIFGHFGFPRLGITGAALATLAARLLEMIVSCYYAFHRDRRLQLKFSAMFHAKGQMWKDYTKYATPVILAGASWGIAMFIQTSILGRMGENAIAANSVAVSLFSVISVFSYGAGNAAGVFTGKLVGEGNTEKLHEYVRTMQILFLLIGVATGGILYACRGLVIALYGLEVAETRALAKQFMTVLSITVIGTSYQVPCLSGIVRGGGHTKFTFYNDLIFQWGVVLVLSCLAAYVWHLAPVWVFLCLKSDQILKCFVAAFEVNSYRWIRNLTRPSHQ